MNISKAVIWLSWLIAVLALVAAGIGLLYQDGGGPFSFTTLHGQTVQMYGQGVYGYETLRSGVGFKGQDCGSAPPGCSLARPLQLALPPWFDQRRAVAHWCARLLSLHLRLDGTGAAYNPLFLVYVTLFSASLFALILAFTSIDLQALPAHFSAHLPRRSIAVFLFAIGLSLLVVWLGLSIVPALLQGQVPPEVIELHDPGYTRGGSGNHCTGRDPGRRLAAAARPAGLSASVHNARFFLGAGILSLSAAQVLAGVLTIRQILGFVLPFVLLTLVGSWLTVVLFRQVTESSPSRRKHTQFMPDVRKGVLLWTRKKLTPGSRC